MKSKSFIYLFVVNFIFASFIVAPLISPIVSPVYAQTKKTTKKKTTKKTTTRKKATAKAKAAKVVKNSIRTTAVIMPNVPQEIGFPDYDYTHFKEADCRGCHGNSLADRHHQTQRAVQGKCQDCHEVQNADGKKTNNGEYITSSASSTAKKGEFGVTIQRNCPTCHKSSWHHKTEYARSGKCSTCHSSDLVTDISTEPKIFNPISQITPRTSDCANCHAGTDGKKPKNSPYAIKSPMDNHHDTGIETCTFCHRTEDDIDIRGCENCHGKEALHKIQPHVASNDRCYGCHGGTIVKFSTAGSTVPPKITGVGEKVNLVDGILTLKGSNFGEYATKFSTFVEVTVDKEAKKLPIVNWEDKKIEARLSYDIFQNSGKFSARVNTPAGKSVATSFSVLAAPTIASISPSNANAGDNVTINGKNFGKSSAKNTVVFTVSSIDYPGKIVSWNNNKITATLPTNIGSGEIYVRVANANAKALVEKPIWVTGGGKAEMRAVRPATASQGSVVRIIGLNFGTSPKDGVVMLGTTKADILAWNSSMIAIRIPRKTKSGTVSVTVKSGNSSTGGQQLTIK